MATSTEENLIKFTKNILKYFSGKHVASRDLLNTWFPWLIAWLIFRPWRWKRHVPPKRRLTFDGLHGIISLLWEPEILYRAHILIEFGYMSVFTVQKNLTCYIMFVFGTVNKYKARVLLEEFVCWMPPYALKCLKYSRHILRLTYLLILSRTIKFKKMFPHLWRAGIAQSV
jgi:hypothetical protein